MWTLNPCEPNGGVTSGCLAVSFEGNCDSGLVQRQPVGAKMAMKRNLVFWTLLIPTLASAASNEPSGPTANIDREDHYTALCQTGWASTGLTLGPVGVTDSGGNIARAVGTMSVTCRQVQQLGMTVIPAQTAILDGALTATCTPGWALAGVTIIPMGVTDSGGNIKRAAKGVTVLCRQAQQILTETVPNQTADVDRPANLSANCAPGWAAAGVTGLTAVAVKDSGGNIGVALRAITILCRQLRNG